MKKRVLAIAMTLAMTLSLLPVSALAVEGETPEAETQPPVSTNELNENADANDVEITVDDNDVKIDEDTQITVGDSVENPVAMIEDVGYATLEEAFEKAAEGATIQMQKDTTLNGAINVTKDITLDLNGKTITSDSSARWAFAVGTSGVTFTIDDTATGGTIKSARTDNSNVIVVSAGNLVVKNGTLENNWYVVYVSQSGTATIEGGTLKSKVASALSTNGSSEGEEDYSGNAVMNVKGGHLISKQDVTIYVPAGTLKVSGGTIEGCTAIYVKSGTTSITGGTIKGTGAKKGYQYVGGGCAPTGDAVVIDACGYPNGDPAIEISGGTFESENASAVADYQHNDNKAKEILVTGGTFDSDVSKYIPSGMKQEGEEVVIDNEKAVASVNGVGYDDLQEAIKNAGCGDTVKLLKETTSETPITISEGQNFTLDLGGNTLTVTGTQEVQDAQAFGEGKVTQTAIANNGTLTIANGTIITTADCNSITNTGTLKITQDTVLSNSYGTYNGRNLIVNLGGTVTTAGQLTSTANNGICTYGGEIAVTGGTISATHYQDWSNCASGITIFNRSYDNNSTGATVTISGGTIEAAVYAASTNNVYSGGNSPSNLTITGGTLTATKSTAIYWPSAGTLTIGTEGSAGGPTINSERGSAVEICSGTLNVYGGTLNGGTKMTEEDSYSTDQVLVDGYRNNSGSDGTGDAVTVISRRGSGYVTAPLTVNIAGGTFNSPKNYGVRYMDCNFATGADKKMQNVQVEITGGSFDGGIEAVDATFIQKEDKDFISGGSYSDSVSQYLTDEVNAELQRATGNTPFSYYKTVEDASADARPGDTVKPVNVEEGTTTTYTVTLKYDNGGADTTITVVENGNIKLPNVSRAGYTFNGWRSSADNDLHKAGTSVTITANTTFTADWTRNQTDRPSGSGSSSSDSGDYLISVDRVSGGRVTVQPGRADKGETVTITVYPNDGYELDELVVTDSRGNEIDLDARSATRFTFTMPGGKVTVEASFVREGGQSQVPQTTFMDVPASAWYYDAVEYVYENGLMSGVSGGRFAPNDTLTRAMLVQTLYAMEGRPAAASAGFADVASGDWYASAVNWAAANGVVSGVSETGFGPNNALTREQLALILYRFAQYKGYDVTGTSDLAAYADGSSVSGWAAEAMGWAVDAGLISGVGGNQIAPTGTASRAQVAQILMNFCENVAR